MARQNWKGGALLSPLPPALISVKDGEEVNVLTVAWCGIMATTPPKTYISVRPQRYSHSMLCNSGEFVINLPGADMARTVDFCGMYTGKKVNKIQKCNLTLTDAKEVKAPIISECPISLECKVYRSENMGTHDVFYADIVSVSIDERILDETGKLDIAKANLLAYAHGDYFALGKKLGCFGFSAMKKNSQKKKDIARKKLTKEKK